MLEKIREISRDCGVHFDLKPTDDSAVVHFDPACIEAVKSAAERCGLKYEEIVSGASHDAVRMAAVAPTAVLKR